MQAAQDKHYQQPQSIKSQRLFILLWVFVILSLQIIASTIIHDSLQSYIADPILYRIRHTLGKTPPVSPKLKILALDDQSVSYLKRNELRLEDLAILLQNIARQKPRVILLDRLFSISPSEDEWPALEKMRQIKEVPIYSGAWINAATIKSRTPLVLPLAEYGPDRWLEQGTAWESVRQRFRNQSGKVYGYEQAYAGAFTGVGHLRIEKGGGVQPFMLYDEQLLLPHMTLYAAHTIKFADGLLINGQKVPLRDDGTVYINHRPGYLFYEAENMRSLRYALERARKGQAEQWIQADDVVVILFDFFTGSANLLEGAPFGDLPTGLLFSGMVDSVIENRWLTPGGSLPWLIFLGAILGTALARYTGAIQFWLVFSLSYVVIFIAINYLFSYQAILVPWFLPSLAMFAGAGIQYIYNRLGSEWRMMEVENQYLMERAKRLEEESAKAMLSERLNLGRAVQEILLPTEREQKFHSFTLAMSYIPAQEMSGDWIYMWDGGDDERRFYLGDVVGKGPSAAIPVAVIVGILGECQRRSMSVEESLERVNQRLIELFEQQISSSCTVICLQKNEQITLYNAGSPGWFCADASGKCTYLPLRSHALGLNEQASFAHETLQKQAVNTLFTFTDGYMEGSRAYKRLIQMIERAPSQLANLQQLQEGLDQVGRDFRLEDDRTLLYVRCNS